MAVRPNPSFLRTAAKVLLVAALAVLAAPQLWYPLGFDQAVYAACGDVIRRGGVPIQDCFETKQAGVMVMYAIPMAFSLSPMAVHAFTLLWTALTSVVVGATARRLFHPAAAWPAAVFYWLAYAGINYWSMDQAETFANLFLVIASAGVYIGVEQLGTAPLPEDSASPLGDRRSGRGFFMQHSSTLWLIAGGACIGIAFWFKYVFGLIGIVLAVCSVVHAGLKTHAIGPALRSGLIFGLAALFAAALGGLYYAVNNAIPALVSQFQFLMAAFPLGPPRTLPEILVQLARFLDNGADVTGDFKGTVPQWIILGGGFPLFFVLAFLGAARWLKRAPIAYVYLAAYFVAAAAIVAWQANYIQYHYTIMIPPTVLAAGAGAALARAKSRDAKMSDRFASQKSDIYRRGIAAAAGILVVVTVALLSIRMLPWVRDAYQNVMLLGKSARDIYADSYVAPHVPAAEYIRSHTQPGDSISVFGDAPWLYTLADRHNATRFSFVNLWLRKRDALTYPLFIGQFYDGLVRNRPVYVILTKPNFPWPNNDYLPDYKAATKIHDYVESNYAYEGENGPFLLFRRKQ